MSKSAKQVAMKIIALMAGDWSSKWEIKSVQEIEYGQRIVIEDVVGEEEFFVTVQKRSTAPALSVEVEDTRTATEREADEADSDEAEKAPF